MFCPEINNFKNLVFDFLDLGFWDFLDTWIAFSVSWRKKVCLRQIMCLGIWKLYRKRIWQKKYIYDQM